MRSFHTSGSCTLPLEEAVVNFIKDHLDDIELKVIDDKSHNCSFSGSRLIFDENIPKNIIDELIKISGFHAYNKNWIEYHDLDDKLKNADVGKIIADVNQIFKKDKNKIGIKSPNEIYEMLISAILSINDIYSTFIELIICNSYICTNEKLYRYELQVNPNPKIKARLGIKSLHTVISKLLGLLYEPNKKSILNLKGFKIDEDNLSIYEKLWLM